MGWLKQIDRTKFPREAFVMVSWNRNARKWFCGFWPKEPEGADAIALGEGDDPIEAMLAMCVELGALADTGEWKG